MLRRGPQCWERLNKTNNRLWWNRAPSLQSLVECCTSEKPSSFHFPADSHLSCAEPSLSCPRGRARSVLTPLPSTKVSDRTGNVGWVEHLIDFSRQLRRRISLLFRRLKYSCASSGWLEITTLLDSMHTRVCTSVYDLFLYITLVILESLNFYTTNRRIGTMRAICIRSYSTTSS